MQNYQWENVGIMLPFETGKEQKPMLQEEGTMDTLSRRKFFGKALLAGAGAVLTYPIAPSDLGRAQTADLSHGFSDIDPGFLAGQVVDIQPSGLLAIQDLDSLIRYARSTPISRTWKAASWNVNPLAAGDCVYVRGQLDQDGVLEVDKLWANIGTITDTVIGRQPTEITVQLENGTEHLFRVVDQMDVETPGGIFMPLDTSGLHVGISVQVIGFHDPATGDLTASRIWRFGAPTADSLAAADGDIVAQTATSVTLGGLTTFFCCGPGGNFCGWACPNRGGGSCGGCRGDMLHMAWPKITNLAGGDCGPFCPSPGCPCIAPEWPRLPCFTSVSLVNPCTGGAANVIIQDCGPVIRCRQPIQCEQRFRIKFDLTPCAFTAIGGNLNDGLATVHATVTL